MKWQNLTQNDTWHEKVCFGTIWSKKMYYFCTQKAKTVYIILKKVRKIY